MISRSSTGFLQVANVLVIGPLFCLFLNTISFPLHRWIFLPSSCGRINGPAPGALVSDFQLVTPVDITVALDDTTIS